METATGAQTLLVCQLCEIDTDIKWKCTDCYLLMCQSCVENIHPKFKLAETHNVVAIKDIFDTDNISVKAKRSPCKTHTNQVYCVYCVSCDKPVCPKCLSQAHQKHDLQEIEEILMGCLEKVKTFDEQMENYLLPLYVKESNALDELEKKQQNHFEETIREIDEQEKMLVSAVKSTKMRLLKQLEESKIKTESAILREKFRITISITELNQNRNLIQSIFQQSGNIAFVKESSNTLRKWLSLNESPIPINSRELNGLPTFDRATVRDKTVARSFGCLQLMNTISLNIIKLLTLEIEHIKRLKVDGEHVWISDGISEIRKYRSQPNVCVFRKTYNIKIYDMSLKTSGIVLFTIAEKDCNVYILELSGNIKKYYSASPLLPEAIHASADGTLYITLRDKGNAYALSDESSRQIVTVNRKKKEVNRFGTSLGKKSMFTHATRIVTDQESIYIIDTLSEELDGQVVSFTKEGLLNWVYEGNVDRDYNFAPSDLVITEYNKLIVTDIRNNLLCILGCDGTLQYSISTEKFGITEPSCLNIDFSGQLWVGCRKDKTSKEGNSSLLVLSVKMAIPSRI